MGSRTNERVLITPSVSTLSITALVESGHGLVGRSGLYLHEVGSVVTALLARDLGRVDILPGGRATQHIVDLFELTVLSTSHLALYIIYERTRIAGEAITARPLFYYEHVATVWTKV